MCLCFKKYAFLEKSVWLEVYHQSDQPEFLYIKWTLCFSVLSHKPHSEQLLLDRKYHIFQTLQFLLTDQTAVVVNFRVAHEIIMCLMKDSRCLLKHANCVDGLPLINCFSTCSESQLTSKCFYVWKVSYFCLMFPFLIGYLKEICRGWSHKNALKKCGSPNWIYNESWQHGLSSASGASVLQRSLSRKNSAAMPRHRRWATDDISAFSVNPLPLSSKLKWKNLFG